MGAEGGPVPGVGAEGWGLGAEGGRVPGVVAEGWGMEDGSMAV